MIWAGVGEGPREGINQSKAQSEMCGFASYRHLQTKRNNAVWSNTVARGNITHRMYPEDQEPRSVELRGRLSMPFNLAYDDNDEWKSRF